MADEITNAVLLHHIHAMKSDLLQQIQIAKNDLQQEIRQQINRLEEKVDRGFLEAREHRQSLQEDLEATMRTLHKHDKQLAKMKK